MMQFFYKQFQFILPTLFIFTAAHANNVCNSIAECNQVIQASDTKIQQLEGAYPELGNFIRNTDGSVKKQLNHYQTTKQCKALGRRLPTAREFAVEATKYGAEILEFDEVYPGDTPSGFKLISALNPDGKLDKFYYSMTYYKSPIYTHTLSMWSSSVSPEDPNSAYEFYAAGSISIAAKDITTRFDGVFCFKNSKPTPTAPNYNTICNSIDECLNVIKEANSIIHRIQGYNKPLWNFIRNPDGTIKHVINQYQAVKLCKAQGKRIPTARELAVEATKYGAEILEMSEVTSDKVPYSYVLVSYVNESGKEDRFYYSYRKYLLPETNSDLENYEIWTSSTLYDKPTHAYKFNVSKGYFTNYQSKGFRYDGFTTVCVAP